MIIHPQRGIWTQPNVSDTVGDLYSSFNLDLTKRPGKIRLGKRLILNTSTSKGGSGGSGDSDLTSYPVGFKEHVGNLITVAGSKVHRTVGNINPSLWQTSNFGGDPTNCSSLYSDIEKFNGALYVTSAGGTIGTLNKLSSVNVWSLNAQAAGSGANMMTVYNEHLYISSAGTFTIWRMDTSDSIPGAATITFTDVDLIITFLRASSNRIWIGTVNKRGGKGYVHEWDGVSASVTKSYRLESAGALSCVIKDDIPYIIDIYGSLLVWNGGTFVKIAGLLRDNSKILYNATSVTNDRFIHPNGMTLVEGKIHILIDNRNYDSSSTIEENIPAGIWEYTKETGLYHKYSFSNDLATDTLDDYGSLRIAGAGGISEMNIPSNSSTRNGSLLAGCTYFTDATTNTSGIFYDDLNDTLQKAGNLVTAKSYAPIYIRRTGVGVGAVNDSWQGIFNRYRKLLNSTDKMIIKYRVAEQEPTEITITWTSTTTFTTTSSVVGLEGYEVEVLQGVGAGRCSHISSISVTGATSTVTVDETYTGATGTAKARLQNWKKIGTSSGQLATFDQSQIGEISTWCQIKIWMLWTGKNELENLIIINSTNYPAK